MDGQNWKFSVVVSILVQQILVHQVAAQCGLHDGPLYRETPEGRVELPLPDCDQAASPPPQPTWTPSDGRSGAEWMRTMGMTEAAYDQSVALLRSILQLDGSTMAEEDILRLMYGGVPTTLTQLQDIYNRKQAAQSNRKKRSVLLDFIISPYKRWPTDSPIKYMIDSSYTEDEKSLIRYGFTAVQNATCIDYEEVTVAPSGEQYLIAINRPFLGCRSYVGKLPLSHSSFGQPLFLEMPGCKMEHPIIRAILHSLGVADEHQREDRDDYLDVHLERVDRRNRPRFTKLSTPMFSTAGTPYDYGSVMQKGAWDFVTSERTSDGITAAVMVPKDINHIYGMGQRLGLSFWDKSAVNKFYCPASCPLPHNCKNNGYPHPRNCSLCVCPEGLGGTSCENVAPAAGGCTPTSSAEVDLPTDGSDYCVRSPNYPNTFSSGATCNWLIKARVGAKVDISWNRLELVFTWFGGCIHWFEIKLAADLSLPGYKLCHDRNMSMAMSETNHVLASFNGQLPVHPSSAYSIWFPPSTNLGLFEVCFREYVEPGCGAGMGTEWSEWTPCDESCSGCAIQTRTRCPDRAIIPEVEQRDCLLTSSSLP